MIDLSEHPERPCADADRIAAEQLQAVRDRLESALGYSGEALMVHGARSSLGCYARTDQGVGEIYAVASRAFGAGQGAFQVQAYPPG